MSTKSSSPRLVLVNRNTQLLLCTKLVVRRWQRSQGRGAGYEGCDVSEMILSSPTQCDVWNMARRAKDYCMSASGGKDCRHMEKPVQRPCAEISLECSWNSKKSQA